MRVTGSEVEGGMSEMKVAGSEGLLSRSST